MAKEKTEIKKQAESSDQVERIRSGKVFLPAVDIIEKNEDILLMADMPGVDEKSIDITLEKNVLTINGNVEPNFPRDFSLEYNEYDVGDFQRSFTVGEAIDQEKIEAKYKNGVLELRLPKAEPAKSKKITIQAG